MSAIAVWGGKVICVNLHGSGIARNIKGDLSDVQRVGFRGGSEGQVRYHSCG